MSQWSAVQNIFSDQGSGE